MCYSWKSLGLTVYNLLEHKGHGGDISSCSVSLCPLSSCWISVFFFSYLFSLYLPLSFFAVMLRFQPFCCLVSFPFKVLSCCLWCYLYIHSLYPTYLTMLLPSFSASDFPLSSSVALCLFVSFPSLACSGPSHLQWFSLFIYSSPLSQSQPALPENVSPCLVLFHVL